MREGDWRHAGRRLMAALLTVAWLAGCADSMAARRTDAPLRVAETSPPSQPAPATSARASARPQPTSSKPAPNAVASAATRYTPAGGPNASDEATCTDVSDCATVLKAMIADPQHRWMQQPATPTVLANGVRLFAYRALRDRLACADLARAAAEVEAVAIALGGTVPGVSVAKAARARALSTTVSQELHAEHRRRCTDAGRIGKGSPTNSAAG